MVRLYQCDTGMYRWRDSNTASVSVLIHSNYLIYSILCVILYRFESDTL